MEKFGILVSHKEVRGIAKPDHTDINNLVGGWFDCVRSHDGSFVGYVNDTGLLDGLPINPIATALFGTIISGSCVIVGCYDDTGYNDGDSHPVPPHAVLEIVRLADIYKMWTQSHVSHSTEV